jgi:hypothetical protein
MHSLQRRLHTFPTTRNHVRLRWYPLLPPACLTRSSSTLLAARRRRAPLPLHSVVHRHQVATVLASTSARSDETIQDTAPPKFVQMELDFFGEPVTFLDGDKTSTSNAMAALDGFLLCVVSKGKTCTGGGDEGGLEIKSAHSAALVWADVLRHAAVWNPPPPSASSVDFKSAPMLVVVAVASVLAQAGLPYVKHLDALLKHTKARIPGLPCLQMYDLAMTVTNLDDAIKQQLNQREQLHLMALQYLLQNEYPTALATYLRILRMCPGDALAMSLGMDLCSTLGDTQSALRYVGKNASVLDKYSDQRLSWTYISMHLNSCTRYVL